MSVDIKSIEGKEIKLFDLKHDSHDKYDISEVRIGDGYLRIFLRPIWASEWWGNSDMIQIPLEDDND